LNTGGKKIKGLVSWRLEEVENAFEVVSLAEDNDD
jgi:hypothetical protein